MTTRRRAFPNPAPRIVAAVLAPVLAIAILTGCSGSGSDSAGSTTTDSVASAATATTAVPGPPPGAEVVGLRDLETGQCFEAVDDPSVSDKAVYLVDCANPHTYEVYDVVAYEGDGSGRGTEYPGVATVQNWSEQACFDRFEAFVGVRWTVSELDIQVWWPSESSWERADRTVICTVVSGTGDPLTGSQRGTGT